MNLWRGWGRYAEVGATMCCPRMELVGDDRDPPYLTGEGEIRISSTRSFDYSLTGVPQDIRQVMRSVRRILDDPYDGTLRSRLFVTDDEGREICVGSTEPKITFPDENRLGATGTCESLIMGGKASGPPITEVLFLLPRQHRSRVVFRRFFPESDRGDGLRVHELDVGGETVTLVLDDEGDMLSISVPGSDMFPLAYTENWLGEPLRILFGQLAYPRIVRRRHGGNEQIFVRPCNAWNSLSDICGLWQGDREFSDGDGFWRTWNLVLSMRASLHRKGLESSLEAMQLTRFYEEVIQSAHASRWVWAMVHASSIEGMTRLLVPRKILKPDADEEAVADMLRHIDEWTGKNEEVRKSARDAVSRSLFETPIGILRGLLAKGFVTSEQFKAWRDLRNNVMHGSLVSPYSSEKDDTLLHDLSGLLHAVTKVLLLEVSGSDSVSQ